MNEYLNLDLEQLTGTLSINADSVTLIGNGSRFQSECHLGQFIIAIETHVSASLFVVRRIVSDTEIEVWKAPSQTITNLIGYTMPKISAIKA